MSQTATVSATGLFVKRSLADDYSLGCGRLRPALVIALRCRPGRRDDDAGGGRGSGHPGESWPIGPPHSAAAAPPVMKDGRLFTSPSDPPDCCGGTVVIARLLILTRLLILRLILARSAGHARLVVVVLLAGLLLALLKVALRIAIADVRAGNAARRRPIAAAPRRRRRRRNCRRSAVRHRPGLRRLLLIGLVLPELFLRRRDQAEIMLGVLVVVFRRDRIAGRGRIAGQLDVFLGDVIGGAPDFHIGPVQFVNARERIMIFAIAACRCRDCDPACDGACFDRSS